MGGKTVFSHRPKPEMRCGFLLLPGEVRNQIYQYYFQDDFRCEIAANHPSFDQLARTSSTKIKLCVGIAKTAVNDLYRTKTDLDRLNPTTIRVSKRLANRHQRVRRETTRWETSLCPLILVCKLIYNETVSFLYRSTAFVFDAPKRFLNFFDAIRLRHMSCITKLELHYTPYLAPKRIEGGKDFTKAHHTAWTGMCKTASRKLVNLQNLKIYIFGGSPHRFFDLRQEIVQPFLQFRRLSMPSQQTKYPPTLKMVKVEFTSYWSRERAFIGNKALVEASKNLHKLYGDAIAKAVMGATESDAMAELMEAWEGEYARFRHHLGFLETGW
ncbi:unnamed protein product [Periconia digitata]|uniref:DUF7730 domain-containing protein n=1 Tax=Periconia digitata TaxID=1303443 RepID=A0A9W4UTD6_9PLEO|nr:unnamed protein product [Periconia digitata]